MKKYTLFLSLFVASLSLTACSTFEVLSLATMVVTGKGFGDHALSVATGQDCNFFNVVQGERICAYGDSAEIMLLTNNQIIDDSLKVDYLVEDKDMAESSLSNSYLVIGSFSEQSRAESYRTEYSQWNSHIVSADTKYRVVVGPVNSQDRDSMKMTLVNEGVESPWLIIL